MIRVDFTLDELNTVASALAQRPYLEVYRVIEKISAAVAATPPDQVQDTGDSSDAAAPVNRAARRRKTRTQAGPPPEAP